MPTKCFLDLDNQNTTRQVPLHEGIKSIENCRDIEGIQEFLHFNTNPTTMLSSPEGFYSSSQSSWDSSPNDRRISESSNSVCSPLSNIETHHDFSVMDLQHSQQNKAFLKFKIEPDSWFRYRYDTEMSGTHGSLTGHKTAREKAVPSVELMNFTGLAFIRVTLTSCNEEGPRVPHPHSLFVKEKVFRNNYYPFTVPQITRTGHICDPLFVRVGYNGSGHVARFEGMCIINSKKENCHAFIKNKLEMQELEKKSRRPNSLEWPNLHNIDQKVEEVLKLIDVDYVCLCFEAFAFGNEGLKSICEPLYSNPIANEKSAKTGKLKIVRINKTSGSCLGGDEIWLLVEKLNKDGLTIKFYQEDENKQIIWQCYVEEDRIDVHHQYAIIFKTPPYVDTNIVNEVEVRMRLERRSKAVTCVSEAEIFVYEPQAIKYGRSDISFKQSNITQSKLPGQNKRSRSDIPPAMPNKRKNEYCDEPSAVLAVQEDLICVKNPDILELLEEGEQMSSMELITKITENRSVLEDLLLVLSGDDVDMVLSKDGHSNLSTSQQLLNLLLKKTQNSNVKTLIDKINSSMFIKNDKDLQDAASTLLSLKEKVVKEYEKSEKLDTSTSQMTIVHKFLDNSGKWRDLAKMWDLDFIIIHAEDSKSPSKWLFNYYEEVMEKQLSLKKLQECFEKLGFKDAVFLLNVLSEEQKEQK